MSKFLALCSLAFKQQFRVKQSSSDGKGKKVGTIVLFVVLALVFVPIGVAVFIACLNAGIWVAGAGLATAQTAAMVGSMILAVQGVTLLFGFSGVISNVFNCKDADKLLYLPVSASTVFLSKFFVTYVSELVTSLLLTAVTLLPFGIGASFGAGYFVLLVLTSLLVPLLPMLVATLIAMPVSLLISKLGKSGFPRTIFNVVLYVALMAVYLAVVQSMNDVGNKYGDDLSQLLLSITDRIGAVLRYIHPDYMLATALVATGFVECAASAGIALAEFCVLAALLFVAARLFYGRLLASSVEGGGTSKRKKKEQTQVNQNGGVVYNLVVSDLKRVLRDPQLGFQAFAGLIVVPVIVIILGFSFNVEGDNGAKITLQQMISSYGIYFGIGVAAYLTLLTAGTNVLGLYPLSRENNSLYLLKTFPVPFGNVLFAKVLLATLVMLATDIVTSVLLVFLWGLNPIVALLMSAGLFAFGFGNMCYTTKGDLKSPKIGWSNFQTGLKNAKNSWFAMLLGLASAVIMALAAAGFLVWSVLAPAWYIEYLMWIVVDLVGALYAYIAYRSMNGSAEKLFADIEP